MTWQRYLLRWLAGAFGLTCVDVFFVCLRQPSKRAKKAQKSEREV